jgi:hypothetical protein
MKKLLAAILAILYLSTSIGATIKIHYCMGKLVEWSLGHNKNDKCGKCGMEYENDNSDNGCCKNEFKQIKLDKDQKIVQNSFQLTLFSAIVLTPFFIGFRDVITLSITEKYPHSNAPPRSQQPPLFLLNCVFRN